jgi:hypothetical protein
MDVDGIVNHYPDTMFELARKTYGVEARNKEELKIGLKNIGIDYADFKHIYRQNYECAEVESCAEGVSKEFLNFYLKFKKTFDIDIIFRTSRPESIYPGIRKRTKNWLASQGIECVNVEGKNKESFERYNPILHVDDDLNHLFMHSAYADKSVLYLYSKQSVVDGFVQYEVIRRLDDICSILENLV